MSIRGSHLKAGSPALSRRYSSLGMRFVLALFVFFALSGSMLVFGLGQTSSMADPGSASSEASTAPTTSPSSSPVASPSATVAATGSSPNTSSSPSPSPDSSPATAHNTVLPTPTDTSLSAAPKLQINGIQPLSSLPGCTAANTVGDDESLWTWAPNRPDGKAIVDKPTSTLVAKLKPGVCLTFPSSHTDATGTHILGTINYYALWVSHNLDYDHDPNNILEGIIIPDTVTSIGAYAFYSLPTKQVHLPASLTYIGNKAFAACHLRELSFDNLTTTYGLNIGEAAFSVNDLTKLDLSKFGSHSAAGGGTWRWNQITDITFSDSMEGINVPPPSPTPIDGMEGGINWRTAVPWQQPERTLKTTPVSATTSSVSLDQLFENISGQWNNGQLYNLHSPTFPIVYSDLTTDTERTANSFIISNSYASTNKTRNSTKVEFDPVSRIFVIPTGTQQFMFRWDLRGAVDPATGIAKLLYEGEYVVNIGYNVTFRCRMDTNPGSACTWDGQSVDNPQVVTVGSKVKLPPNPTKAGVCYPDNTCYSYVFDQWISDPNHPEVAFDAANTPITQDANLYATWKIVLQLPPAGGVPIASLSGLVLMILSFIGMVVFGSGKIYTNRRK